MRRWAVILFSAASAVAGVYSLAFIFRAYTEYRNKDFLKATANEDFTKIQGTDGTCVEVATKSQFDGANFDGPSCKTSAQKTLRKAIMVHIHAIYYTYFGAGVTTQSVERLMRTTLGAVLNAGDASNLPSLNYSVVYDGLVSVAAQTVPTGCDTIYAGATYDETYAGYLTDGEKGDNWPLGTVPIVCDAAGGAYDTSTDTGTWDSAFGITAATGTDLNKLYTHCVTQFRFASSGTSLFSGTFGIPEVGTDPGPMFVPYPTPKGFNSTSSYSTKARIYLGQRYGLAIFAYVPMVLASAYLTADAFIFFLAEATANEVAYETAIFTTGTRINVIRDSLVMAATSEASRAKRLRIGAIAVFCSLIFWAIFIAAPWGVFEGRMGRPECESGAPQHGWKPFVPWKGTNGGWKADYDAQYFEIMALILQGLILLLLPITTTGFFNACNRLGRRRGGSLITQGVPDVGGMVDTMPKYRRFQQVFLPGIALGGVILIVGQAVSGARFGMAWAEGVVELSTASHEFQEVTLSAQIFDQTMATLFATLAVGLVLGAAVQRHLINGVGCYSAALFVAWLLFCIACLALFFVYAAFRSVFHLNDSLSDCNQAYPEEGYKVEKGLCEARWYTFLIGAGIIALVMLFVTVLGCIDAAKNAFRTQNRSYTRLKSQTPLANPLAVEANKLSAGSMGGYSSSHEEFFNFKTDALQTRPLLHAPPDPLAGVRVKRATMVRFVPGR